MSDKFGEFLRTLAARVNTLSSYVYMFYVIVVCSVIFIIEVLEALLPFGGKEQEDSINACLPRVPFFLFTLLMFPLAPCCWLLSSFVSSSKMRFRGSSLAMLRSFHYGARR